MGKELAESLAMSSPSSEAGVGQVHGALAPPCWAPYSTSSASTALSSPMVSVGYHPDTASSATGPLPPEMVQGGGAEAGEGEMGHMLYIWLTSHRRAGSQSLGAVQRRSAWPSSAPPPPTHQRASIRMRSSQPC